MAKKCTSEKTARRQEWIENGLLELMRHRRFEEITVTDLCRHLGLSRRSFYRYFQDLEDVLDSMMKRLFQSMVIREQIPNLEELRNNYEFWLQHRNVLDALNRSHMLEKLFEYTRRFAEPMDIRQNLSSDALPLDLHREASLFAIHGSVSLVISWYQDGFRKTPEEMARITHHLLFRPLLREP